MTKFYDDGVTIVALCTLCIGALGMVANYVLNQNVQI